MAIVSLPILQFHELKNSIFDEQIRDKLKEQEQNKMKRRQD
jgi:hypothetical protein